MKLEKVLVHATQALCAAFALALVVAGCERQAKKEAPAPLPEVYPAESNAYMSDPAFKAQVAVQEKARNAILGDREVLLKAFKALEDRAGSLEAARALPEWKTLESKARALACTLESNRMQSVEMYKARVQRAREDSARIARGEAKAKEISK